MHDEPGSGSNPFRAPAGEIDPGDGSGSRTLDRNDPFDRPRFLLGQRALAMGERYDVWDESGQQLLIVDRSGALVANLLMMLGAGVVFVAVVGGALLLGVRGDLEQVPVAAVLGFVLGTAAAFVVSVRWARRPDVRICNAADDRCLLVVRQKTLRWLTVGYVVLDANEGVVAHLSRNHAMGILRRCWEVSDRDGRLVAQAREDHLALALARRLLGSCFGLLRTAYVLTTPEGERIGRIERRLTLLDRYVLDLCDDRNRVLERRVAVALGLMVDVGHRR